MANNIMLVLVLRRNEPDIEERKFLENRFPNVKLRFVRADPADCIEHDRICALVKPDLVLLPKEEPIPTLAMERGVKHVALTSDGRLKKLICLQPVFEDL